MVYISIFERPPMGYDLPPDDGRIKKGRPEDLPPIQGDSVNYHIVSNARRFLITVGTRMAAIKFYRHFSQCRILYSAPPPIPVNLTKPVFFQCGRGPPLLQTHYG